MLVEIYGDRQGIPTMTELKQGCKFSKMCGVEHCVKRDRNHRVIEDESCPFPGCIYDWNSHRRYDTLLGYGIPELSALGVIVDEYA